VNVFASDIPASVRHTVALALFRPEMYLHNAPNLFFCLFKPADVHNALRRDVLNDPRGMRLDKSWREVSQRSLATASG